MSLRNKIEFQLRVARRIPTRRFFGLFIGLALPTALILSALIGWHNSIVGAPTTADIVLRAIVVLVALAPTGVVVFCLAILPAIREERRETGGLTNHGDTRQISQKRDGQEEEEEEAAKPLSDRDRDRFLDLLDNPPAANEALRRAARKQTGRDG